MVSQYYHPYYIGGKEIWCRKVSEQLVKRGFKISVLTSSNDFESYVTCLNGVRIIRQRLIRNFKGLTGPLVIPKIVSLKQFDLVHFIEPSSISTVPFLQSCAENKPFVVNLHNDPTANGTVWKIPLLLYRKQLRRMLLKCKKIITYEKLRESKLIRGLENKSTIMTTGLDLSIFRSSPKIRRLTEGNVLFIGRLDQRKGIEYLFEAVKKLRNLKLTVVGGNLEDIEKYKALAMKFDIDHQINFTGWISYEDLTHYFFNSDLLVLPSIIADSFPQVCLQSLACMKPVVVSNSVDFSSTIEREKVGVVVPPRDPDALAEAIRFLLDNPEIRREMGERGRRIAERYGFDGVASTIEGVYREILGLKGINHEPKSVQ